MARFKRIMVGLDLTAMDDELIKYVCRLMTYNPKLEDIYFLHVASDLIDYNNKRNGVSPKPIDELLMRRMKDEVHKCAEIYDTNIHFDVLEGDPLARLVYWSEVKRVDLMIAGKKNHINGKGIVMEKMAQKSHCSILFVPENYSGKLEKVLLPVDFSEITEHVFQRACSMAQYYPNTKFICQHVVEIPAGYTRLGKHYDEVAETMIGHATKRWECFKEHHEMGCMKTQPEFTICEHDNIAKTIFNYAKKEKVDMIIIGSKEQTAVSHFFLGSVAEKVIGYDHDILMLLVKHHIKEEVYDFFKAMKKI